MSTEEATQEILARVRRLETRMTRYLTEQGFETGAKQPVVFGKKLLAPGYHTSIAALLTAVPESERNSVGPLDVYIGDRHVATLYPEEANDAA